MNAPDGAGATVMPDALPSPVPDERPTVPRGAGPLLGHLARLLASASNEALEPLGLRPRHLVALTMLREHEGVTQQLLATLLRIDRTNLVGLLNELESAGWIERRRDEADRRRHLVGLTPAGIEQLTRGEAALGAAEDQVLGALEPEERRHLHELLRRATTGHAVDCGAAASEAQHTASSCAAALQGAADSDGC